MVIHNMNQLIRMQQDLGLRKIGEQYYIFSKNNCYELNMTGAIIVNTIGRNLPVEELCNKLSQKCFFADVDTIMKDLDSFLDFLITEKLVDLK